MTSTMTPPASPPASPSASPSAQPTAAVRRAGVAAVAALACATFAGVPAAHAVTPTATTVTFSYTGGAQYYTVPAGVNALQVTLTGAAGGSLDDPGYRSAGGLGAVVTATLPVGPGASVHAGDVLVTQVGGAGKHAQSLEYNDNSNLAGGYNGGGDGGSAGEWANYRNARAGFGGGGASDIRLPGGALSDRVVVAAGGGGGTSFGGAGGHAGQDAPQNSVFGGWDAGGAGTETRGGWHATGYSDSGAGTNGSFGQGGVGGSAAYESEGGGGGGGYYGGGGGAADDFGGTGGGGGSSYTDPAASGVTVATTTATAGVSITAVPDVPTITAHPDVTASATSAAGATVAYTTPTASDPLDGSDPVSCIPAAGATFPIGSTTVSCTTQNQSGNSAASTFTVTVADTTKPVLATHPDITATATSAAGAAVTYTAPGASDNVDGTDPVTCTPPSGATFPVGSTTVTCTARDKAANTATSTFTVAVAPAPVPNKADLKVTVSGPGNTTHGAKATYTVTVSNTGPAAASAVTTGLATTGLGALTLVGATSGTIKIGGLTVTGTVWKLPTLASGASTTFTVTGIVTATAGHPVTAATATLATTPDPNLANNYALTTTRTTT